MKIWLIKDGEPLPVGDEGDRLLRTGLLSKSLADVNNDVVWWSSTFNHHKKEFRSYSTNSVRCAERLTINQIKSPGYRKNISIKRLFHNYVVAKKFKELARKADKPDIIICCVPTVDLAKQAIKYGKQNNIPVIIDLRDMWPDIFLYAVTRFKWVARILLHPKFAQMKYVCTNATGLIGVSDGYLNWGLNYAGRNRTSFDSVFPLGYKDIFINSVKENSSQSSILKRIAYNSDEILIVYLGSLSSKIDFTPIITAVSNIGAPVKLIIAGLGDTYNHLSSLVRDISNIVLTGWIEKNDIKDLLAVASLGLYPYPNRKDFCDHFPNKFVEYLCSGTPILSRVDSIEMRSFLFNNRCGVCYNDNVEDIETLILGFLIKRNEMLDMGQNARNVFEKYFDAKEVYSKMADHIQFVSDRYVPCNRNFRL